MEIICHKCGTENWLENQSRCFKCNAILRRCIDCTKYDKIHEQCREQMIAIEQHEAQQPSLLSPSTNCLKFQLLPQKAA